MAHEKRSFEAFSADSVTEILTENVPASPSSPFITLPLSKKARLSTTPDDLNGKQEMGGCMSMPADRGHDQDHVGCQSALWDPSEPLLPAPSSLSYGTGLLPTPEPESPTESKSPPPGTSSSCELVPVTPSPSIATPTTSIVSDSISEMAIEEKLETVPTESAGNRFWKMLQNERKDYLECFFEEVFDVRPATRILKKDYVVKPYYLAGMLIGAIRAGATKPEDEDNVVKHDNVAINISAMLVNKEFREAGSRLFYGAHAFYLSDPINADWWSKRIGAVNFSNLRELVIEMGCGWKHIPDLDEVCTIDQSEEERWCNFLKRLKKRHQLRKLTISFDNWKEVDVVAPFHPELQDQLDVHRSKLRDVLWNFRGLKHALLVDRNQISFDNRDRDCYSMLMIQSRGSVEAVEPQPKMNLEQFLEHRKRELAMGRMVIEREEKKERKRQKQAEAKRRNQVRLRLEQSALQRQAHLNEARFLPPAARRRGPTTEQLMDGYDRNRRYGTYSKKNPRLRLRPADYPFPP